MPVTVDTTGVISGPVGATGPTGAGFTGATGPVGPIIMTITDGVNTVLGAAQIGFTGGAATVGGTSPNAIVTIPAVSGPTGPTGPVAGVTGATGIAVDLIGVDDQGNVIRVGVSTTNPGPGIVWLDNGILTVGS